MPAGLQVMDASGAIVVDTTTVVLKEIVASTVTASTTSLQSIPVTIPSGATLIAAPQKAAVNNNGVEMGTSGSNLTYRFNNADGLSRKMYGMLLQ